MIPFPIQSVAAENESLPDQLSNEEYQTLPDPISESENTQEENGIEESIDAEGVNMEIEQQEMVKNDLDISDTKELISEENDVVLSDNSE